MSVQNGKIYNANKAYIVGKDGETLYKIYDDDLTKPIPLLNLSVKFNYSHIWPRLLLAQIDYKNHLCRIIYDVIPGDIDSSGTYGVNELNIEDSPFKNIKNLKPIKQYMGKPDASLTINVNGNLVLTNNSGEINLSDDELYSFEDK